jgi:hypothetical protein
MKELQQINLNIETYRRLLTTDMPERGKEVIREEISWLENQVIPQYTFYDV